MGYGYDEADPFVDNSEAVRLLLLLFMVLLLLLLLLKAPYSFNYLSTLQLQAVFFVSPGNKTSFPQK